MKIAFDAKRAFNNFTGLGNYSRFIINALTQTFKEDEHLLFTPKIAEHTDAETFLKLHKDKVKLPSGIWKVGSLQSSWRSSKIGKLAGNAGADVFHGLSNELPSGLGKGIKKVVTIHDLIFLRYPDFYPAIDRMIYKKKFKSACERADQIIAVSEQTKSDIIEFFGTDANKIHVVYQGVHPLYTQDIKSQRMVYLLEQYNLMQPYFLYVGSIEERKNAEDLVRAFKLVLEKVDDDLLLLIVGRKTDYQKKVENAVKELQLDGNVRILNQVPFKNLPFLYKGALASVYPSSFEGFGIPVLESLMMRTPVVSGKGSSLEEAGGKHALYADPKNHEELSEQMLKLVSEKAMADNMLKGVETHLEKFSPGNIAQQMRRVYEL
ncbi:glycosyl transferase family 1 [Marivirga lumbricoides]|uniref:Glycosyl transferase family 1 n=1 Tax=Marivirga lumbricoides TaxID=1046115 RepID=A0ABQ1LJ62_9BACT|nr:glycosyl transferase family 1 [Marivirga lumbricoides]